MAEEIKEKPAKKKFQMPNTYVILFAVIAFIALLTWFVPGGAYELSEGGDAIAGTYHVVESNPQGLWDIFMAPITGMLGGGTVSGAISISLTIMLFGSLLEMMDRTCALKTAIKRITIANQNNMHVLIAILVILMAFFGTLEGAYEEGIVYFLMFVPVILALGLDTVTAIMIVVLGTQIGCLSSIINPFSTGIASGIAGISPGEGMIPRIAMFIIFTGLVILLICRYADKIKAHPEKSVQFFRREQDLKEFPAADDEDLTLTGRQKGALVLFVLTFAFMIVGLTPWTSLNPEWTFFEDFTARIAATPVLRNILGTDITAFGNWYFPELSMITLIMVILIGVVMRYNADAIIDTILKGASGLVSTAFVVPLARGIQVVMDNGQITPSILNMCENALASLPPLRLRRRRPGLLLPHRLPDPQFHRPRRRHHGHHGHAVHLRRRRRLHHGHHLPHGTRPGKDDHPVLHRRHDVHGSGAYELRRLGQEDRPHRRRPVRRLLRLPLRPRDALGALPCGDSRAAGKPLRSSRRAYSI